MKKEKIIYQNQKEIKKIIFNYLQSILDSGIKEAYLFGSSINGTFGVYKEKQGSHFGSDIDVIIFLNEPGKISYGWKFLNTEKSWWRLYRAGRVEINNTLHKVDALIVKKGKEDMARKSKLFDKGVVKIK